MADEVVIVGTDGTEHVFPPGFDPKQAAAIVRSKDPTLTRQAIATQFAARPIADIGFGGAMLGAQSDPRDVLAGALGAVNPLNWIRGAMDAGHLLVNPSEISDAALRTGEAIQAHPGAAAGGALMGAAIPPAFRMAGRLREATAPFAETLITKKLGMDPDAISLQATRLRLQSARSRTRQAARAEASAQPSTPVSSARVSTVPESAEAAPSVPEPPATAAPTSRATATAARLKLTADEYRAFRGLVDQGYPEDQVLRAIEGQRAAAALASKLGTPSDADVASAVADRNATGRWPQD